MFWKLFNNKTKRSAFLDWLGVYRLKRGLGGCASVMAATKIVDPSAANVKMLCCRFHVVFCQLKWLDRCHALQDPHILLFLLDNFIYFIPSCRLFARRLIRLLW